MGRFAQEPSDLVCRGLCSYRWQTTTTMPMLTWIPISSIKIFTPSHNQRRLPNTSPKASLWMTTRRCLDLKRDRCQRLRGSSTKPSLRRIKSLSGLTLIKHYQVLGNIPRSPSGSSVSSLTATLRMTSMTRSLKMSMAAMSNSVKTRKLF